MNAAIIERNWVVEWFDERQCYHMPSLTMAPDGTLLAVWNGGFLRTVLQGLAVTCAALLALSALGAGLTLGGVIGQQQLSAAAVVISFLGVFPGAWLTARHAAGQKLPAAIAVGVCCLAVCMLVRLLFFGNREAQILPGMLAMLAAAALGGIAGSTQRKPVRRRRR